jgi:hypothetical protein
LLILKKLKLVLIAASFMTTGVVFAQSSMITGAGANSCSQFLESTSKNPASDIIYISWMQGYLTAFNAIASFQKRSQLLVPDGNQLKKSLEQLCANNLKLDIYEASTIIMGKLPVKAE